jgi:hypothetical protein
VTHQGSSPVPGHDSLVQQLKLLLREIAPNTVRPETTITTRLTCHFCHQPCLPFVRWVFLSQFSSKLF